MTELRTQPRPPLPELDAEEEVDVGRYWRALLERWWLPLAGLAIGIVLGYLASLGGSDVYRARATVYLGQPLSPTGAVVQSIATNPTTVPQIVQAESTIQSAASQAGMRAGELRGHISTSTVSGALNRQGQNPLVNISVTADAPGKAARAANALAAIVVQRVSGYVNRRITSLREQLDSQNEELATLDQTIAEFREAVQGAGTASPVERLIVAGQLNALTLQRGQIIDDRTDTEADLSFAQSVEAAQIVNRAAAVKTTAQSRRNSVLVGAVIGLLLGILAALLWEPGARIVRRSRM